jgi:hypothetical protein
LKQHLNHIRHTFNRNRKWYTYLLFFLAIFYCSDVYSQLKNEDELKKQAETYFENEDYSLAYKLYAQLVSLYPKDPDYNYKLGVCMLFTEPDKKKPYSYLQIATKNPSEAPKDALFYLGKTYHINYKFDEAIKLYTEYKKIGSSASLKKLQVDREIQACKNGKRLLSNLTDLVILSKKQLNEANYYNGYDVKEIGGKLLVKPDEYKSGFDKKKKDKSVVYLPKSGERLYYSSYGENGNNGRDIYFVNKLPNGTWSKASIMPSSINTEFDEDYPFLHPNGKTLYFSSKGHNSMGGYDVFKTSYDDATQTWSKPQNLEFPINSPDDDILFVTDSLEKTAFFSTGRYSPYGKLDVLKINTERRPMNFAFLKGTVVKEEASQSVKSKITVKNMANGEIVGTYQAGENGDYNMELPNGGKFIFTVETPDISTQSDAVQIPVAYTLKPYKQMISYDNKILKITNYFDGEVSDDNYSMMIDLIEKKAKLEVNENEPYNNNLIKDTPKNQNADTNKDQNLNSVSTTNPTVQGSNANLESKTNTNKNVTNEQLLEIAKADAKEAGAEALKLKQEAQDAFGLATQKTAEAVATQKEADDAIANANTITDIDKKNEELAKANQLKEDSKIASNVAKTATNLAKKLEVDADIQQKEADLTNQYITQLETVTKNKNNKEALTKLEQIQKELDGLSNQKNQSDELFSSLKAEVALKQKEITNTEKKNNAISTEINAIKNESESLEKDLANESDKSIKENISAQIRELTNEIDLKNKDLASNNQKIETLRNEVDGVNQELLVAAKILNESTEGIAVNSNTNKTANNNSTDINANANSNNNINASNISSNNSTKTSALSYEGITSKYNEKINPTSIDKTNKEEVLKQNEILKTYNKEVSDLIALDKNELNKTKDASEKNKINEEIKLLEKQKTDNDKAIASNNSTIKQLESNPIANNTTANNNNNSIDITSNNSNKDVNSSNTDITNTNNNNTSNNENAINTNSTNAVSNNGNNIVNAGNNDSNSITNNAITNNGISNEQGNNDNVVKNNNSNNINENQNGITNITASNNEVIKPINTNNTDNSALLNELSNLKNGLNTNSNAATDLFGYNNYKESTSLALKQTANKKFDEAKQNETNLNALIAQTENNIKIASNNNANALVLEAENLNDKAFEQRKESTTKTGAEKDALLKQAIENETTSVAKKLEASVIQEKQNKAKFDNNNSNLIELQKLTGEKTSNEISQANMLTDEASINFKQAQKMRQEADAYPSGAAKLGGLSNAEEKENEALAKQQRALELFAIANPTYKVKQVNEETNPTSAIANVNAEVTKLAQAQVDAYLSLSKVNQNEIKLQSDMLLKNPSFKNVSNKSTQELKTTSDKLNNEAKTFIGQSLTAPSPAEKANLLLKANEKEIAAIKTLQQANDGLNGNNNAVATNNSSENNNTEIANNSSENATTIANNNSVNKTNNTNVTNTITPVNSTVTNTVANNIESNTTLATNTNTTDVNTNNNTTATNNITEPNKTNNNNSSANINEANNNSTLATNNNAVSDNNILTNNNVANSTNINGNEVKNEVTKLKTDLNNPNESIILTFNPYLNKEASDLKDQATAKINEALAQDKKLSSDLDNVNQLSSSNSASGSLNQNEVASLLSDADKLNEDASALRKSAASKSGSEKEAEITAAKSLETAAINKKVEAAKKQEQLNSATYEANKQSLEELSAMASGKNIAELKTADAQLNEVSQLLKQATNLRVEANAYPSDAAKLGGYSNAEEKEAQAIAKQETLLNLYKKQFPNYIPKNTNTASSNSSDAVAKLNETKNNLNNNNQTHVDGLSLLIQANDKEYSSRLNTVPTSLNENQTALKNKAETSYSKKDASVAQANQTNDLNTKKNLLIDANKYGVDALSNLNQITNPDAKPITFVNDNNTATVASNNTENKNGINNPTNNTSTNNSSNITTTANTNNPSNNVATNNNSNNSRPTNNINTNKSNSPVVKIKVEGLEVKNTNAYTADKPIPIDEKIPDGLVFKVQIGAFKSPLPNNTFKGLTPVIAQTTPSGYIRYMAGNFDQYGSANAVKNDLRNLGYSDAFVVAYYNGVRINLNEATDKAKASGQTIEPTANTSAGITANSNIPKNTFTTPTNNIASNNSNDTQPADITNELEKMNGLLYTVQIGVYSKQVTRGQLFNLKPIYTEKLPNGLYRYTAGIYNQSGKLLEDKRKVVDLGVKDAFVSSYYNAKRIPFAEGQKLQTENNNLKMETENPIIFNGVSVPNPTATNSNSVIVIDMNSIPGPSATNTPSVTPFSNGVTSGPAPTAENGVKTDEIGISFKVQIGAYKNQVPNDVASKFLNIKTWPVQNVAINGLYIYTIGNFTSATFAKKLKDEAISVGITDAYITVYKDGKKIYGAEATQYLSR